MTLAPPCRIFFYGTLLPGERDHALLAKAQLLGPALTEPLYQLVELNVYAALIPDGKIAVHGELYAVDLETRRRNRRQLAKSRSCFSARRFAWRTAATQKPT